MPRKNTERTLIPHAYYHVYNRGVEKRIIFEEEYDYRVFLNLLQRYLGPDKPKDSYGRDGVTFYGQINLAAFCLIPNHFHLLLQTGEKPEILSQLLLRVGTAYTMYFNKKNKRVGPLFQSRFRSSRIHDDAYLLHISRYIHLNPKQYKEWPYSSYGYYRDGNEPDWLVTSAILELFDGDRQDYLVFVSDYEQQKEMMDELKYALADH